MAAANESQGLKIAVAIFVALTVLLAVTAYFMYAQYSKTSETLADKNQELQEQSRAANQALQNFRQLRDRAGYAEISEASAVMNKVAEDQQQWLDSVNQALQQADQAIQQARQAGASSEAIASYQARLNELRQLFNDESVQDPTFRSTITLLTNMLTNEAQLATTVALNNVDLRNQLQRVNNVNNQELQVQEQAVRKTNQLLSQTESDFSQEVNDLRATIAELENQNAQRQSRIDELQTKLENQTAQLQEELRQSQQSLAYWRTRAEKDEVVLDNPDGYITYVDYTNQVVRTNLTREMGAQPQMIFSVFDANAPGLPSDEPKARIMLTQVNETFSMAEIQHQFNKSNPVRQGDQVYSAAWSPNEPQRFALVGPIDMDRDGRDDREDLKRLIRDAGGVIDYDLPPPNVGNEQGEMTARTTWYVIDERDPIRFPSNDQAVEEMTQARREFIDDRTEAIERARELGIRPLRIERLLSSLGYSFGMTIPGQVEAADRRAINNLLNPGGMRAALPGTEEFERQQQQRQPSQPTGAGAPTNGGGGGGDLFEGFRAP